MSPTTIPEIPSTAYVEIELPDYIWDVLDKLAEKKDITRDELVNNILKQELDKYDELLSSEDSCQRVEADNEGSKT